MSKLPAFQFYPGDWRKDPGVQSLSFHDRGVWFEIILLMHESDCRGKLMLNGQPMPMDALARLLGLDNQNLATTLTTLLTFGVASKCETTGALMCRRMIRDEHIREVRKIAGKKGGNPRLRKNLDKQIPTTLDKQIPTPSSSSSDEDGVLLEKPKRKRSSGETDLVFDQFWSIYPRHTDKAKARKAWVGALSKIDCKTILEAAERFKKSTIGKDQAYIPHASTWLNGERWEDDLPKPIDRFAHWYLPIEEREALVRQEMYSP